MKDLDMDKFYAILNKLLMELDAVDNPKIIKLLKAYNVKVSRENKTVKVDWDWTQLETNTPFLYFRY